MTLVNAVQAKPQRQTHHLFVDPSPHRSEAFSDSLITRIRTFWGDSKLFSYIVDLRDRGIISSSGESAGQASR